MTEGDDLQPNTIVSLLSRLLVSGFLPKASVQACIWIIRLLPPRLPHVESSAELVVVDRGEHAIGDGGGDEHTRNEAEDSSTNDDELEGEINGHSRTKYSHAREVALSYTKPDGEERTDPYSASWFQSGWYRSRYTCISRQRC